MHRIGRLIAGTIVPVAVLACSGPLPAETRLIEPHGRFCVRLEPGWNAGEFEAQSESFAVEHGDTQVRLYYHGFCYLTESPQREDLADFEERVIGFGRRATLGPVETRYGQSHLAWFEPQRDSTAHGVYACVTVERGWMILAGSIEEADRDSVERIMRRVRVDCNRFDPEDRGPLGRD